MEQARKEVTKEGLTYLNEKGEAGPLLPVPVFSKLFRGLMLAKLLAAHKAGQLKFFGQHTHLAERKAFVAYLAPLRKRKWYVYSKPPFGGPNAVLAYLSR